MKNQYLTNNKKIISTCLVLYVVSQIFFLINIQFPKGQNFDEAHFVPSAKQFLELRENRNWEHPPFGKELIAVGIGIFGDRPIGWRFMSTIFGSLTLVGMYLWGLAMFRKQNIALWVAALTMFNQLLYVQARIGMLDTFMTGFMVWGLAAFTAAWDVNLSPARVSRYLTFAGLMFGLAIACKWAAVVPWVMVIGLVLSVRLFQKWGVNFSRDARWKPKLVQGEKSAKKHPDAVTGPEEFYSPMLWRELSSGSLVMSLAIVPLIAYFATFVPFLFVDRGPGVSSYGLWDILKMQPRMWGGQLRVVSSHPYMSNWLGWAVMARPIWYTFNHEANETVRGVILLGNPLVMLPGLIAVAGCLWAWLRYRSREGFLIGITYCALFFCWAVIPRKITFYYYYYPAGMTLSMALAYSFVLWEEKHAHWFRWVFLVAVGMMFIYFFPILAALEIPISAFKKWMWFRSWI